MRDRRKIQLALGLYINTEKTSVCPKCESIESDIDIVGGIGARTTACRPDNSLMSGSWDGQMLIPDDPAFKNGAYSSVFRCVCRQCNKEFLLEMSDRFVDDQVDGNMADGSVLL